MQPAGRMKEYRINSSKSSVGSVDKLNEGSLRNRQDFGAFKARSAKTGPRPRRQQMLTV